MLRRDVSLTPWLQPALKRRPARSNPESFRGWDGSPQAYTALYPRERDRVVTGCRQAFPGASWPKTGPFPSSAARVCPQILPRRPKVLNGLLRQQFSLWPRDAPPGAFTRRWSLGISHANGVPANQPRASEERAPPWENRCVIPARPARAGAASVPKPTLLERHLIAIQQRSEFRLKSDLRPCRAQEPG
jgi:hypothetical protein